MEKKVKTWGEDWKIIFSLAILEKDEGTGKNENLHKLRGKG